MTQHVRRAAIALVATASLTFACVDAFGPGNNAPATVRVAVELPAGTPAVWSPAGETLHVAVRRAGRPEPIVDSTFVIGASLEATLTVPLAYNVERFVISGEVRYRGTLLFLGFEAIQLRSDVDTSVTMVASYVGPGARAATFELGARDSTLAAQDTASLIRVVRDSGGLLIPNVPARFVTVRPALVVVDTAGVLTALRSAADTARVLGYLPTGLSSNVLVSVVDTAVTSIEVSPANATLTTAGATSPFTATARNAAGEPVGANITWTSGSPSVAIVDQNGTATAVANGTSTITATNGSVSGTATLTVSITDTQVASITVDPSTATLTAAGSSTQFTAQSFNAGGAPVAATFAWQSSNTAVATVDQSGIATAVANGSATITASAGTVSGHAELTVALPPTIDPSITRTWVGGDAGGPRDWTRPANWNPVGVPTNSDSVVIVTTTNDPMLSSAATIARLRIVGGNLALNGQQLTVTGDFSTENGVGTFNMVNPADTLRVLGNALFNGGPSFDEVNGGFRISEGALFVAGTFERRAHPDNPSETFRAVGIHRTILNGPAQQLLKADDELDLGSLEIANTGGVRVEVVGQLEINATLRIGTPVAIDLGSVFVDAQDSLQTVAGSQLSSRYLQIGGPMAIAGAFLVDTVEFDGEGDVIQPGLAYQRVIVSDSMLLGGATNVAGALEVRDNGVLVLNGQTLTVDSLDVGGGDDDGYLVMKNAADVMTVSRTAVFRGDQIADAMTAGTLRVAGDFRVIDNARFQASGTHRTILNGSGAQQLRAGSGDSFGMLEITNATGPINAQFNGEGGMVPVAGTFAVRTPISVSSLHLGLDVGDSLVTVSGSSLNMSLIARGALRIEGTIEASSMEYAGINQDISSNVTHGDVTISGQARLITPMTFTGFTGIRGGNLTLNGQRLTVAGDFFVGVFGEQTGTLTMQNAADSLVVTGNVQFTGASSVGLLTAGTVAVGGGFFAGPGNEFQPTATHTTVLNGAGQQIVGFDDPAMTGSRFNHLELANATGSIRLQSPVFVAGTLITRTPAHVSGSGTHLLSVGSIDVSRVTFDRIRLAIGSGALTRFDTVTFTQQDPASVQLTIAHPGSASAVTFTNNRFLTTPTTGSYVSATDIAATDGNVLTIEFTESVPSDGSAHTTTSGGAVVQWTGGGAPIFTSVAAGLFSSCALTPAGRPYCWGDNTMGQLGDGTTQNRHVPAAVTGNLVFAGIAMGSHHACGITSAGVAYCWGSNEFGQLGDGSITSSLAPQQVAGGSSFTRISLGEWHSCGLTADGSAYCWGRNFAGQLGDGSTTDRTAPTLVAGGLSFTAVTAKASHSCALTGLGAAYCWGGNVRGQLGDGSLLARSAPTAVSGGLTFSVISTGRETTCGVTDASAAYCWGEGGFGQIGDGTQIDRTAPTAVAGGLSFEGVSAGGDATCGWTTTGVGYCWGLNNDGQLGDGTITRKLAPVAVLGDHTFNGIDAGRLHALGWTTAGISIAWGFNGQGGLGDGTTTSRNTPVIITPP